MRHAIFEVPSEVIADFSERLSEIELENSILNRAKDDEIIVKVSYQGRGRPD